MRYRRKKFTFAISSPDEFLLQKLTEVVEVALFTQLTANPTKRRNKLADS